MTKAPSQSVSLPSILIGFCAFGDQADDGLLLGGGSAVRDGCKEDDEEQHSSTQDHGVSTSARWASGHIGFTRFNPCRCSTSANPSGKSSRLPVMAGEAVIRSPSLFVASSLNSLPGLDHEGRAVVVAQEDVPVAGNRRRVASSRPAALGTCSSPVLPSRQTSTPLSIRAYSKSPIVQQRRFHRPRLLADPHRLRRLALARQPNGVNLDSPATVAGTPCRRRRPGWR